MATNDLPTWTGSREVRFPVTVSARVSKPVVAPNVARAQLASVLIPFLNVSDKEEMEEFKEVLEAIWDLWCEEGKNRERIGEFVQRVGMGNFLDAVGLQPVPEMVAYPRDNPYVFYGEEEEDEDDDDE